MSHPEYLYYALFVALVLPSSFVSRVAAVLVVVRLVQQGAYWSGLPEAPTQAVTYGLAFFGSMLLARRMTDFMAAAMFYPLAVTAACQWFGVFTDCEGWWMIYGIACAQTIYVPFDNLRVDVLDRLRDGKLPRFWPSYPRAIDLRLTARSIAARCWPCARARTAMASGPSGRP